MKTPLAGIIMGSKSDLEVMTEAAEVMKEFGIPFELTIVSAHRTPDRMAEYARSAASRGLKVIIAGAGGAAHLPGMTASYTELPVIGVPIRSRNSLDGRDSILSILQMPDGIPVATVNLNGARNAGLLAARILALHNENITEKITGYQKRKAEEVIRAAEEIEKKFTDNS